MIVGLFLSITWLLIIIYWMRYSYTIDDWEYTDDSKGRHFALFVALSIILLLFSIVYGENTISNRTVKWIFVVWGALDIVGQVIVFLRSYKPSLNPFRQYRYGKETRFRLRISSAFSSFLVIWGVSLLF